MATQNHLKQSDIWKSLDPTTPLSWLTHTNQDSGKDGTGNKCSSVCSGSDMKGWFWKFLLRDRLGNHPRKNPAHHREKNRGNHLHSLPWAELKDPRWPTPFPAAFCPRLYRAGRQKDGFQWGFKSWGKIAMAAAENGALVVDPFGPSSQAKSPKNRRNPEKNLKLGMQWHYCSWCHGQQCPPLGTDEDGLRG